MSDGDDRNVLSARNHEESFTPPPRDTGSAPEDAFQSGVPGQSHQMTGLASDMRPKSREERLREFYSRKSEQKESSTVSSQAGTVPNHVGSASSQHDAVNVHYDAVSTERNMAVKPRGPPSEEAESEALHLKKQGNDLYAAGDFEAAVEFYTTAIKSAPAAVLYSNRAAAYMMLGWWDQALRDTKIAIRKDPSSDKAMERHSRCLLMADRFDDAMKIAADIEARIPLAESQRKQPLSVSRLRWLAENARSPSDLEKYRHVVGELSKAELTSPLGVRLRKGMAKCLVERADALENQRKIRPAVAQSHIRSERDVDEITEITPFAEEAIEVTGALLEDNADDADVRLVRARALVRLGRHADAEEQLHHGLRDSPGHQALQELAETIRSLDAIQVRGNEYYKAGKLAEAIQAYTEGIERDPDCVDTLTVSTLYYNRSAAYRLKGDGQKALQDVNTSLALRPKWAKALYRRGIIMLECGRAAEALTELKTVQRADPTFDDDLETWLRRAHHWLSKSQDEKDYYRFMRIPMDSSKDDIRKQYHKLCLLWHPDKNPTDEGRARFDELQEAYKFLMDDKLKEQYDFGIWKDKAVRHHAKFREKVCQTWNAYGRDAPPDNQKYDKWSAPAGWGDKHLEEDDKVEHISWGDRGAPEWLQTRRKEVARMRYGTDA